jgi:hypothetical protein
MKRILLVLGLVLLSSLLFAQDGPDPLGNPAQYANTYRNMYYWQWIRQVQEPPESQNQFMEQARLGEPANESAEPTVQKEQEQRQERSGDCSSECDGEPVQDQVRDQLRDGSCGDGADGPDQDRTRSGRA